MKLIWCGAVLAAIGLLVPVAGQANEVTLNALSFLPASGDSTQALHISKFVEQVNQDGKGQVQIRVVGGPEALAASEQPNAVSSGAVDMIFTALTMYHSRLPLTDYYTATSLTPMQRRELGVSDYLNELHAQAMNTRVLADYLYTAQNVLYFGHLDEATVARIAKGDFTGLRMRGGPPYAAVFAELGIENYPIAPPDIYTAIERRTVDGYAWPSIDMLQQGWGEITEYRLEHPFNHGSTNVQINLDVWNELGPERQEILSRVAEQWERWSYEQGLQRNAEEAAAQIKAGVKPIALTQQAAAGFTEMARRVHWENLRKLRPDAYARLSPLEAQQ